MRTIKHFLILIISLTGICLNSCKSEEILFGEISGNVTDAETTQPLHETSVVLLPSNDTTNTTSDGKYLFSNLKPGNYEIQASKLAYEKKTNSASVTPSKTTEINFALKGIPVPEVSIKYLDFGIDATIKFFTISNLGKATLKYSVNADQKWIDVYPASGEVTTETDTLKVTIKRTEMSEFMEQGKIHITSIIGQESLPDTISVFVNGVMDRDFNYYNLIKIGTQTWMAENLYVGNMTAGGLEQTGTQTFKKYCYGNNDVNCRIYGGLYTWSGMMQGAGSDSAIIGTTRGICPVGWHLPTMKEWNALISFLDETVAGAKLKEAGISHWRSGNVATNESGFTALPGGIWDGFSFGLLTTHEYFWTATTDEKLGTNYAAQLEYNSGKVFFPKFLDNQAMAVRCIMDPPK